MRIGITGANGIIGKILVNGLKGKYEVIGIDFKDCDINRDLSNPEGVFDNIDVVIHLAGNPSNLDSFENLVQPNIVMCQKVYEECKKAKVKKVIFASTNHTQIKGFKLEGYGNPTERTEHHILSQNDAYYPDSFYACTKIFGEMLGKYYSEVEKAYQFIAIRIGWVIRDETNKPDTDYFRAMWLTQEDCIKVFEEAIQNKNTFDVIYGVSGDDIYAK